LELSHHFEVLLTRLVSLGLSPSEIGRCVNERDRVL
jgi:hypothetical protein